jgi:hypothetical protein
MKTYSPLIAIAAIAGAPAPAAAQTAYPYPQPQVNRQAGDGYSQPGHSQDPTAQKPIAQVIDSLLGNRYKASGDRAGVSQCASAALAQATIKYGVNGHAGSDGYAGYAGAYRPGATGVPGYPGVATSMRVSAITDVQRPSNGMRVKGLIDSGVNYRGGYGGEAYQGEGYGGQPYATLYPSHNDLSFRCNLNSLGIVTSMHIDRNTTTYRRF